MIDLLVYLAVAIIVFLVVWWLLQQLSLPEPLAKIVTIVLVVVGAVIAIGFLLHFAGVGPPMRLR